MKSVRILLRTDYCNGHVDNSMCKAAYKVRRVLNKAAYICREGTSDCMCRHKEDRVNSKGLCNGVNKPKLDCIGFCKFRVNAFFGNCHIFQSTDDHIALFFHIPPGTALFLGCRNSAF